MESPENTPAALALSPRRSSGSTGVCSFQESPQPKNNNSDYVTREAGVGGTAGRPYRHIDGTPYAYPAVDERYHRGIEGNGVRTPRTVTFCSLSLIDETLPATPVPDKTRPFSDNLVGMAQTPTPLSSAFKRTSEPVAGNSPFSNAILLRSDANEPFSASTQQSSSSSTTPDDTPLAAKSTLSLTLSAVPALTRSPSLVPSDISSLYSTLRSNRSTPCPDDSVTGGDRRISDSDLTVNVSSHQRSSFFHHPMFQRWLEEQPARKEAERRWMSNEDDPLQPNPMRLHAVGGQRGTVEEFEKRRRERYIEEIRAAAILEVGEDIVEFVQRPSGRPIAFSGDGEESITAEEMCMAKQKSQAYMELLREQNPFEDEEVVAADEDCELLTADDCIPLWSYIQILRAELIADEEAEKIKARRTEHRNFSLFMSPLERFGSPFGMDRSSTSVSSEGSFGDLQSEAQPDCTAIPTDGSNLYMMSNRQLSKFSTRSNPAQSEPPQGPRVKGIIRPNRTSTTSPLCWDDVFGDRWRTFTSPQPVSRPTLSTPTPSHVNVLRSLPYESQPLGFPPLFSSNDNHLGNPFIDPPCSPATHQSYPPAHPDPKPTRDTFRQMPPSIYPEGRLFAPHVPLIDLIPDAPQQQQYQQQDQQSEHSKPPRSSHGFASLFRKGTGGSKSSKSKSSRDSRENRRPSLPVDHGHDGYERMETLEEALGRAESFDIALSPHRKKPRSGGVLLERAKTLRAQWKKGKEK